MTCVLHTHTEGVSTAFTPEYTGEEEQRGISAARKETSGPVYFLTAASVCSAAEQILQGALSHAGRRAGREEEETGGGA